MEKLFRLFFRFCKFKLKILLIIFCFSSAKYVRGQVPILESGNIEYEMRVNKYLFVERGMKQFRLVEQELDKYKASQEQFFSLKSNLRFTGDKSLYTPVPDNTYNTANIWNGKPIAEQLNIVFSDFDTKKTVQERSVAGSKFLVKDSLRAIKWKITDQTREIAGFQCKRANGVYLDSVYVVAFYTNEIPVEGGPESFHGLPGMILGLALPYEGVTWFATRVDPLPAVSLNAPNQGTVLTFKMLEETLLKSYGADLEFLKRMLR